MKTIMRATYGYVLLLTGGGCCWGQNAPKPVEATLCDLYHYPEQYVGQMVKVRGGAISELRIEDILHDSHAEPCPTYMRIVVVFPDQVNPRPISNSFETNPTRSWRTPFITGGQSTSTQPMKAASMRRLLGATTRESG